MCDSSGPETLVTDPHKAFRDKGTNVRGPGPSPPGSQWIKEACKAVRLILKFQFISSNIFKGLSEKSLIFPDFRKCEWFEGHIWGKVLD